MVIVSNSDVRIRLFEWSSESAFHKCYSVSRYSLELKKANYQFKAPHSKITKKPKAFQWWIARSIPWAISITFKLSVELKWKQHLGETCWSDMLLHFFFILHNYNSQKVRLQNAKNIPLADLFILGMLKKDCMGNHKILKSYGKCLCKYRLHFHHQVVQANRNRSLISVMDLFRP